MRSPARNLPGWSRFLDLYCTALFVLYVLVILGHRSIPSLTDYANWTYQGVLLRKHLLGLPDAAHVLKNYPVPNSAATVGIGLLCLLMSWQVAAKLWLVMQLALALVSIRAFVRVTDAGKGAIVLGSVLFLNVNLWDGFINFQMGLSCVLFLAALLLRRQQERSSGYSWVIGALLLLTFFVHMVAFAFGGLLVVLYCVQTCRFRVLWQLVPSGLACAWYVAGRYLLGANGDGEAGQAGSVRNYSAAFWALKGNSYLKSVGLVNPTYLGRSELVAWAGDRGFLVVLGLDLAFALAIGWCVCSALRRGLSDTHPERFVWVGVVALLPLYLVAPVSFLGISDPGSRLLQLSLVLGFLLCARMKSKPLAIAQGCAVVLMTLDLVMFFHFAYGPERAGAEHTALPPTILSVARVFNHNQDHFLRALERGDETESVFPTGIFLNQKQ